MEARRPAPAQRQRKGDRAAIGSTGGREAAAAGREPEPGTALQHSRTEAADRWSARASLLPPSPQDRETSQRRAGARERRQHRGGRRVPPAAGGARRAHPRDHDDVEVGDDGDEAEEIARLAKAAQPPPRSIPGGADDDVRASPSAAGQCGPAGMSWPVTRQEDLLQAGALPHAGRRAMRARRPSRPPSSSRGP